MNSMKFKLSAILIAVIFLIGVVSHGQAQEYSSWTWNEELADSEHTWTVNRYEINGSTVDEPVDDNGALPIVEGSEIRIEITGDPSEIDMAETDGEDSIPTYFTMYVDDEVVSFGDAGFLQIVLIYPVVVNGSENIFEDTSFSEDISISDGVARYVNDYETGRTEYKWDVETGVLQFLSSDSEFDEETEVVEIEINSGLFGFDIPVPIVWFVLPLMAIPLLRRKFN